MALIHCGKSSVSCEFTAWQKISPLKGRMALNSNRVVNTDRNGGSTWAGIYRRRLNPNISVEKKWLQELEDENRRSFIKNLPIVYDGGMPNIKPDRKAMEPLLNKKLPLEKGELVWHLAEVSLSISNVDKEE